eukprot:gene3140-3438_t
MTKHGHDQPPTPPTAKRSRGLSVEDEITCVNNVRVLAADLVEKANSGHPGAPMGCAPIAHVLFGHLMNFSPSNPKWANRDRFVLSNGHACALLYTMLHLTGYKISIDDLKQFRQLGSYTPGHPENILTPGVEVSTGPLGQGISNAVGLAMAEKHLAAVFNRDSFNIVDHYTYVICGDGCLQEGVSSEASSLAGHLGLGKLIVCYDDNKITIDGDTSLSFTEDVSKRYESYGWHVLTVEDGNDIGALTAAIEEAKAVTDRPSLLKIRTVIGFGSSKAGSHGVHGAPLGKTDLAHVKEKFGFNPDESFAVKSEVYAHYRGHGAQGEAKEEAWKAVFQQYAAAHPDLAADFERRMAGQLPANWKDSLPTYSHLEAKAAATRNRSEEVLNALAVSLPELMGGSADLTPSNLTFLKCSGDFQAKTPAGRYVRFGVREHAMAAICNGLQAHGGIRPYCATFLNFIGYALGAVRVSALSHFPILFVMTHDSIGLGEDGPTHQPIESLEVLRATPNLLTFRPADGKETVGAYVAALERNTSPSVISLSRQACPTLEHSDSSKVALGGYVVQDHKSSTCPSTYPTITLVSTGTEVSLTLKVAQALVERDSALKTTYGDKLWVRVVSMPCVELFDAQDRAYQLSVFLPGSPVMSIEAAGVRGWQKYAHVPFGIDNSFGLSAPAEQIYNFFGFTVPNLSQKAQEVVAYYAQDKDYPAAESLVNRPHFPTPALHFHH